MARAHSVLALLLTVFGCASSGLLQGPVQFSQEGYSYSQSQSSSYDSSNGNNNYLVSSYNQVQLTPPECSVIRRKTYYEPVLLPFFCQGTTGRSMPMPQNMDQIPQQVLMGMKAEGWSICQARVTVPMYRMQRIPICCPGTRPYGNGACIELESSRVMEGPQSPCANGGRLVVFNGNQLCQCRPGFFGYRCMQAAPRMPDPRAMVPTPGQLLVSSLVNRGPQGPFPGYQVVPSPAYPPMPTVQAPRPLRPMFARLPNTGSRPGSLINQLMNKGRAPSGPFAPNSTPTQVPSFGNNQQPPMPPSLSPQLISQNIPRTPPRGVPPMQASPVFPPNMGGDKSSRDSDMARYMAAVLYQRLLQEGLERQLAMRKQMEDMMKQRLQQHQQLTADIFSQDTTSSNNGNAPPTTTDPSPIPPPPLTALFSSTSMPPLEEGTTHDTLIHPDVLFEGQEASQGQNVNQGQVQDQGQNVNQGQGQVQGDMPWSSSGRPGILDSQQTVPGQTLQMFGNGPGNVPPGSQPDMMTLQDIEDSKQKVETLVNGCLTQSGITRPLKAIMEAQDMELFKQVCSNSQAVGPCIMQQAQSALTQDRKGMIGRQMLQTVLMFLGQLCHRMETAEGKPGMTSQPVFPNPPPSINPEVTTAIPEAVTAKAVPVKETKIEPAQQPTVAELPKPDHKHTEKQVGSANAHVQEEKPVDGVSAAAFPMWMILAMVGGCAALLFITCLTVCLCLRCRRKRKSVEINREPSEKKPSYAVENNFYATSPYLPPPEYPTTIVQQTLGGDEEEVKKEPLPDDEEVGKESA